MNLNYCFSFALSIRERPFNTGGRGQENLVGVSKSITPPPPLVPLQKKKKKLLTEMSKQ